jgi:hypothetical protein
MVRIYFQIHRPIVRFLPVWGDSRAFPDGRPPNPDSGTEFSGLED